MANISVLNTNAQVSGKTLTTAEGDWTVSGAWIFSGNQTFTGNVSIGNAVSDTLTITSTIISSLLFTDATYDIGASGATRPRDLFLSRNAVVGGTLGVTGVATLSAATIGLRGVTYTLPSADGAANTVLSTNGSATLSWAVTVNSNTLADGRLTLTTGVPVTTSDVTGAGTIYYTPYRGNKIALYDGSTTWTARTFTELSLALTATSGKPYDVFVYDNAGVATLETLVWTNDTTRATALVYQDGVLVKSGATTRRYVGSFYASGSNTTEDSYLKRYLWNYYNRVERPMRVLETTGTWAYTLATLRQANAAAGNQLDFIVGVVEDTITASVAATFANSSAGVAAYVSIGLDSTSAGATGTITHGLGASGANQQTGAYAQLTTLPTSVGRHKLVWLEYSSATGTTTWYGANTIQNSGISGFVRA